MGEPLVPLRITFEVTAEPWELPIDAIVLSVGATLGGLASAMRSRFPDLLWDSVNLATITQDKPGLFGLGPRDRQPWLAIMATPHEDGGLAPTITSIEVATRAAIREAARNRASSVGIPMLATGALGIPVAAVAAVAVPAAIDAAHQANLEHLAFLTRRAADVPFLEAAADGRLARPDTLEPHDHERRAFDLAGGVSTDRVDPNTGIPLAKDQLGVAPYVSMLAAMIADRNTPTPLSVGIFGEWGSGKSYFMGLLRSQVDQLAGKPGYCGEVAQIGFNAWHYADTNLWASLGDEIFRQLAGPGPNSADRRRRLRAEMAERLDKRRELEVTTQQARSTVAKLQASVDDAAATREIRARDLIAALRKSPELRINALWRKLGVDDAIEQAKLLSEQLHGTLTEVDALRRAPRDRIGKLTMAVGGLALVACAVLAAFAPEIRGWLAGIGGVFAVVSGIGVTVLTRARSGLRALRSLSEYLRSAAQEPEVAATLGELRQAEADQRVAQAQLDEVVSHVGELGRQLTELAPGRRLYSFIVDRAQGDAYAGNLGLISMIRKDFEQLIELMADWREHPDHDNATYRAIDRIVLYIDDLDRCGPAQVVEVLQAVHLLLALDLFVVVIGVDPRWLLRSLASHYDEILDTGPSTVGDAARWHVTPEDYLEKIINIPIALPGMPSGSLRQLLRSIVDDDSTTDDTPATTTEQPTPTTEPVDTEMPVEPGSEISDRRRPTTSETPPRPLTEKELVLLSTLDVLIDTPREAKRLFNLYRMLRATRDLSGASRFLGEDGEPGDYEAVVVLLGLLTAHSRLLERVLDTRPDPDNGIAGGLMSRPPDADWAQFVADFEPRDGANRIVGTLAVASVPDWTRLHAGLARVSAELTLSDLSRFQEWVPRIRRFSYTLSSAAKNELAHQHR
jgi:KAP-like P-loop domain-containing protein